jgi:hypothetical protein
MGGANGSRECAPDDKLRDTHQLLFMGRWVRKGLNPSYELNPSCGLPPGTLFARAARLDHQIAF